MEGFYESSGGPRATAADVSTRIGIWMTARLQKYSLAATRRKRRWRPWKRRRDTVISDLKAAIDPTWDEAAQLAVDRQQWRRSIARCAHA